MKYVLKDGKLKVKQEMPEVEEASEPTTTYTECIGRLLAYNAGLQIAHWQADTVTNEHKALGDLYSALVGLLDDLAEVYMGKAGVISPTGMTIKKLTKPCVEGLEIVEEMMDLCGDEDQDLMNILADMQIALNKAKYLLKEK